MIESENFSKIRIGYEYLVQETFTGEFFVEGEIKTCTIGKGEKLISCIFQGTTEFKEYQTGKIVLNNYRNVLVPVTEKIEANLSIVVR